MRERLIIQGVVLPLANPQDVVCDEDLLPSAGGGHGLWVRHERLKDRPCVDAIDRECWVAWRRQRCAAQLRERGEPVCRMQGAGVDSVRLDLEQRRVDKARWPDTTFEEVELPAAQRRVAVPFERRAAVVLSRLGLARRHKLPGTRAFPHPLEDKDGVLPQPVLRQRLGEVSHRLVQRRDLRLHN